MLGKLSIERCHVLVKLGDLGVSIFDAVLGLLDILFHLFWESLASRIRNSKTSLPSSSTTV